MDRITLIGMIAASCTTFAFIPQVYKVYKTKLTRDLSLPMYVIFSVGVFLWFIYGFIINNLPIMFANGVTFVLCVYILAMMIKNRGGKA